MKYRIEVTGRGQRGLERARKEVFAASQNEGVTAAYMQRIEEKIEGLRSFPENHPLQGKRGMYRKVKSDKYYVYYRIEEDVVVIVNVRYAGRKPWGR